MRDVVLFYIKSHPPCTNREIAKALGTTRERVYYHVVKLRKLGLIETVKRTWFCDHYHQEVSCL